MKLFYQSYPEHPVSATFAGQTPLIIIPGLFGSSSNWRSFAKQLSASVPTMPVIVVDQRNHGQSPHAETNLFSDMVADLLAFCDQHNIPKAYICGHSMGGKVAMLFALKHPDRVRKLIVLDIAPIAYSANHTAYLEALTKVDLNELESRSAADRALREAIPDTATRLFLLQSLSGSAGGFYWRLNIPVLHRYMQELSGFPEVHSMSAIDCLFIAGENSDYLLVEHHIGITKVFPQARFASVADAGHWLHTEQPQHVLKYVQGFLVNGE